MWAMPPVLETLSAMLAGGDLKAEVKAFQAVWYSHNYVVAYFCRSHDLSFDLFRICVWVVPRKFTIEF